jgi:hypothetical protein
MPAPIYRRQQFEEVWRLYRQDDKADRAEPKSKFH